MDRTIFNVHNTNKKYQSRHFKKIQLLSWNGSEINMLSLGLSPRNVYSKFREYRTIRLAVNLLYSDT